MPNRYGRFGGDPADPANDWQPYQPGPGQMQTQNTGVSGYGPGGTSPPGLQPAPAIPPNPNGQLAPPGSPGTWQGNQPGATTWQEPGGWTGTSAVGGPEQFGGDYQKWFMSLVGNRPWNQQTLNSLMPVLSRYGIKLTPPNANQEQTKIQLPDGTWVRVGFGEGHPVWAVQPGTGPNASATGATGAAGAGGIFGAVNPNANKSQWGLWSGELGAPAPFQAPTLADLQATPGYQAGLNLGQQAMERSAAAKGSLLSGGFQQALNRYAQNYAQTSYQNAFNNALAGYNTNVLTQSQQPWQRYQDLLNLGQSSTLGLGQIGKTPVTAG